MTVTVKIRSSRSNLYEKRVTPLGHSYHAFTASDTHSGQRHSFSDTHSTRSVSQPGHCIRYSRDLAHTLTPGGATAAMVLSRFEHVSSRLALSCVAPSSGADVPCTAGSGTPHRDPPVVAQHIAPLHGERRHSSWITAGR